MFLLLLKNFKSFENLMKDGKTLLPILLLEFLAQCEAVFCNLIFKFGPTSDYKIDSTAIKFRTKTNNSK